MFYYEEEEAGRRDPHKDLELHQAVCAELRRSMLRIKELKAQQSVSSASQEPVKTLFWMSLVAKSDVELVLSK